ncbi:MAG: ABC transporter ATP-binding protein [Candidatus Omnitrophota bacterium]|nr:ABC transporter ATP-binding protein [Candidatus Omnitrophota bacterium]
MKRVMVQSQHLTKTFGSLVALNDVSLDVPEGEILALVGPNGAGKTTALKLLVGLLTPTAGSVRIDGFDVIRDHLEVKRRLAFLPDQPFLYEQLTVAETLSFIGGLYELSPEQLRERSTALLSLFGLTTTVRRRVGQLSFGMKSRLALITSLLRSPRILIMDEPFFGLDPQTLRLIKQHLAEQAQAGMTIVLSTHQLPVVEDVAHRIAILDRSRLMALGTLEELTRSHGGHRLEEVFFHLTSAI